MCAMHLMYARDGLFFVHFERHTLEQTNLLRTRYLWVYFYYPTRQQFPPPIPRTCFTGSNRRLEAKGQRCVRNREEMEERTRGTRTKPNRDFHSFRSRMESVTRGVPRDTFSSLGKEHEPTLVPPAHPLRERKTYLIRPPAGACLIEPASASSPTLFACPSHP